MKSSTKTTLPVQYKGIDILYTLDQNIVSWKSTMTLLIMKSGLDACIEPEVKPDFTGMTPEAKKAEEKRLKIEHATFELTLMQHIGGEVRILLLRLLASKRGDNRRPNGNEAWAALTEVFKGAGSSGKHLSLTQIFEFAFPRPVSKEGLTTGLQTFENIVSTLGVHGGKLDDDVLAIKLASALPRENIACNMVFTHAMQSNSPVLREVVTAIEQLISQFAYDEHTIGGDAHALASREEGGGRNQVWCEFEGIWTFHTTTDCFKNPKSALYKGGNRDKRDSGLKKHVDNAIKAYHAAHTGKPAKGTRSRQQKATKRQIRSKLVEISSEEEGYFAHDESASSSNSDNEICYEYSHVANDLNSTKTDSWIADSGATSHMTHSSLNMYDVEATDGTRVRVGNGSFLNILCKGKMDFLNKQQKRITLYGVLYVPGIHVNLISICKLQRRRLTTTFPGLGFAKPNHAFIRNSRGNRILSAHLKDSLYCMEMTRVKPKKTYNAFPAETLEVLHQRFGHLPIDKIRLMKEQLRSQNITILKDKVIDPCLGCATGKLHRKNRRTTRTHLATEALEVIHTDVSGPYTPTQKGNKWLIIFIDEFTRLATIYAMKNKSDALACFRIYKMYIENDRKLKIKNLTTSVNARDQIMRLQSDGGGEYKSTAFGKFLEEKGIQHYTSCADTPSQNGIAERHIRSITETGFSMLRHSKLEDSYWAYAMRTAAYILNRLPKPILAHISPYEKWTGISPDLRPLRTFGVDAHVRIVTQNMKKGGAKSHKCIFLGYREGLKGYVFQTTKTKRIITNGDATFYEGDWLVSGIKRFDFSTKPDTYPQVIIPSPLTPPLEADGLGLSLQPEWSDEMNYDGADSSDEDNDEYPLPNKKNTEDTTPHTTNTGPATQDMTPVTTNGPTTQDTTPETTNTGPTTQDTTPETTNTGPTTQETTPATTTTENDTPATTNSGKANTPLPEATISNSQSATTTTRTRRSITFAHNDSTISQSSDTTQRPRRSVATYNRNYDDANVDMFRLPAHEKHPRISKPTTRKRGRHPDSTAKDKTQRKRTPRPGDDFPDCALNAQGVHSDDITCPLTYRQALASPQKAEWIASMHDELKSLRENDVFGPAIKTIPRGKKGISSKWVFVIKRDENGKLLRYKARLVARGFTQRAGIDYDKTFAPVMKQSLLRTVLAEACHNDWEIDQIDIKTAFLYGKLDETIFLKLPDGTFHHLQRALYGLKQAGRQWYARFHKSLERFGLQRLHGDPCCYHMYENNETLIVMIHVDDAIITGSNPVTISALKQSLRDEYRMTDLGAIKHCLGWEISRDRTNRVLTISQRQYITELLNTYHVSENKTKSCPSSNTTLVPIDKTTPKLDRPYMELLGAVLYVANSTRPDISYAVSELSRYSSHPGREHWNELKRVLYYLNETKNHGIVYQGSKSSIIHGYVDASYARCPVTRRSRHGAILLHSGGAVDWRSKMQQVVATSSMEAEYIGLCAMVKMARWLHSCMHELKLSRQSKIIIGMDNKSAIIFAEEQMVQERSKHIDIKFHYTRDQIEKGLIGLEYVPTNRLPADMLTKPLPKTPTRIYRKDIGILPILRPQDQVSLKGAVGIQP